MDGRQKHHDGEGGVLKRSFNTAASHVEGSQILAGHSAEPDSYTSSIGLTKDQDKQINAAAESATGGETGFIGRADQTGFHDQVEKKQIEKKKKERRDRDFERRLATQAMQDLQKQFDKIMENWQRNIDAGRKLGENILNTINDINERIDEMKQTHTAVNDLIDNGLATDKSPDGSYANEDVQKLVEAYNKRTGNTNTIDDAMLISILHNQIEYEQTHDIPSMQGDVHRLSGLYNENEKETDASQEDKNTFEENWNAMLDMPDDTAEERQAKDTRAEELAQDADRLQAEHAFRLSSNHQTYKEIAKKYINIIQSEELNTDHQEIEEKNEEFSFEINFDEGFDGVGTIDIGQVPKPPSP